QRLDRPVDRDRCQPLTPPRQPVEHLVGADRLVRSGDLAEHRLAQGCELQALVLERPARTLHCLLEAEVVVVSWCRKGLAGDGLRHRGTYSTGAWLRHPARPPANRISPCSCGVM